MCPEGSDHKWEALNMCLHLAIKRILNVSPVTRSQLPALYVNNHVRHFCWWGFTEERELERKRSSRIRTEWIRSSTKKDLTNLRKVSIIMWWSVLILWQRRQTNQRMVTLKRKFGHMRSRPALNVVRVIGSQDTLRCIHSCSQSWPLVTGSLGRIIPGLNKVLHHTQLSPCYLVISVSTTSNCSIDMDMNAFNLRMRGSALTSSDGRPHLN